MLEYKHDDEILTFLSITFSGKFQAKLNIKDINNNGKA